MLGHVPNHHCTNTHIERERVRKKARQQQKKENIQWQSKKNTGREKNNFIEMWSNKTTTITRPRNTPIYIQIEPPDPSCFEFPPWSDVYGKIAILHCEHKISSQKPPSGSFPN